VDLPNADFATDLYLLGVHLKCCGEEGGSEDASRQRSADAIANWLADARGAIRPFGNLVILPPGTPMVVLGDFNLVGGPRPELTLLTGDIQQEVFFGPDAKGDWDNSDLTNLNPLDPFTGDNFTWQSDGVYPSSALDRMFYTDSVLSVAASFVLNTATMAPDALAAAGLQAFDTNRSATSDHLPIVMDIAPPPPPGDGDFDADGDVDLADYARFQRCFGSVAHVCAPANVIGPGPTVDAADFALWSTLLTGPTSGE
jgi:endonuclease/exonuclease/phosphatase family metal-dependent hydrolase